MYITLLITKNSCVKPMTRYTNYTKCMETLKNMGLKTASQTCYYLFEQYGEDSVLELLKLIEKGTQERPSKVLGIESF